MIDLFKPHIYKVGKEMGVRSFSKGITLIELMIVVAVVGILAAIAYPSYQDQLRKAARAAAQGFMLDIMNRQQQYYLDQRSFASAIGSGGLGLTTPKETEGRYTYAINTALPAAPPPCYTITATATGSQTPDGNLTLDCKGNKTRAGNSGW